MRNGESPIFERIVVIAPNWLGDAVMALPALAAVQAACPGAALIAAGRASTIPLFSMVPGIDAVVRLDSRGGIVGAVSWAEDAAALRVARADVAILLPNSFRSAWTAQRAGIAERWGYTADLRARLLTRAVPRLRRPYHMAEYYLHLVRQLVDDRAEPAAEGSPQGLPLEEPTPQAPARTAATLVGQGFSPARLPRLVVPAEARQQAEDLLARLGIARERLLVGLAPGAAYGRAKQWPPERFAALAVDLHQRLGATSLLFGARADAKTTRVVARIAARAPSARNSERASLPSSRPAAVVDLAGETDLPLLVALMARCRSIVSNDSGAMHVAAAAGVPVTAVFGATDEHHTAPLLSDTPGVAAHEILASPVWCRPCMLRECPIDHRCMRRVDAAAVAAAVERQIKETEDR